MATLNGMIHQLQNLAPELRPVSKVIHKNTVPLQALLLEASDTSISPCIYVDDFLSDTVSDEEAAHTLLSLYHSAGRPNIDPEVFTDPQYIRSHLSLGLERQSADCEYLTKSSPWNGIQAYLFLRVSLDDAHSGIVRVREPQLLEAGISVTEAWQIAEREVKADIRITNFAELLGPHLSEFPPMPPVPLFIVTNSQQHLGAAAALNQEALKQWARERQISQLLLIFSSIHEVILLDAAIAQDLDTVSGMMQEINRQEVSPTEQLADHPFLLRCDEA